MKTKSVLVAAFMTLAIAMPALSDTLLLATVEGFRNIDRSE